MAQVQPNRLSYNEAPKSKKYMRLLREFNPEAKKLLIRISRQSQLVQVRERANCIILSYQGFSIAQLMEVFRVSRRTLYN